MKFTDLKSSERGVTLMTFLARCFDANNPGLSIDEEIASCEKARHIEVPFLEGEVNALKQGLQILQSQARHDGSNHSVMDFLAKSEVEVMGIEQRFRQVQALITATVQFYGESEAVTLSDFAGRMHSALIAFREARRKGAKMK